MITASVCAGIGADADLAAADYRAARLLGLSDPGHVGYDPAVDVASFAGARGERRVIAVVKVRRARLDGPPAEAGC
jgi:hypothetical protein